MNIKKRKGKHFNEHRQGVKTDTTNKPSLGTNTQEIKFVPEEQTVARNYQNVEYKTSDLTKLENCIAVFNPKANEILKLSAIDYRGQRFELNSDSVSLWLRFVDAELFIYTVEEEFNKFYNKYKEAKEAKGERAKTAEKIFNWLAQDANRLTPGMSTFVPPDVSKVPSNRK